MTKVVIIGGGYAGVHGAKILNKAFKKEKEVTVTLIDKNPYHTLMTELHEVAGNRVDEDSVKISYSRIFSGTGVNCVRDRVTGIDREKQIVKTVEAEYSYDYLMVGIGAEPTDFGIPGIKEHSYTLWSLEDALRIREHIKDRFRKAAVTVDREARKRMLTFAVAGAGFTGVEMVGELIEWLPLLCEEYGIDKDEYRLINVEALGQILNMIPDKPRNKAMKYMEKKGVEFMLKSLVSEAREGSFSLKDGRVIESDTLIWTCGVKGNSQGLEWGLTEGHVTRLRVDETMRTPEYDNVFVVGDSQWFLHENERPIPQIVEAAEQTAAVAAKNIIRDITGKGKEAGFKANFHGFMVSVGGRYGVSHTMGFSLSGIFAMAMKHLVNCYYLHGVCGLNGWSKYLGHEIFHIRNKRSFLGGLISGHIQGLWAVPLRLWLGLMWFFEGLNKVGGGWLNRPKGSSSSWMFSSGVIQKGMPGYGQAETVVKVVTVPSASEEAAEQTAEAVTAATGEAAQAVTDAVSSATAQGTGAGETATDAVAAASEVVSEAAEAAVNSLHNWGHIWNLEKTVLNWNSGLVTWFRETFMDGIAAHIDFSVFQHMVVIVECLIGLALIGGLFTFPAAGVSIIMCLVFILSGLFSWSQVWFIFAAFLLLGGSGRTLGLDYWVQPWLKGWWNRTGLARRSHLYMGEPGRKRK